MMSRNSFSLRLPVTDHDSLRLYVSLAGSTSMDAVIRQTVKNYLRRPQEPPAEEANEAQGRSRIPVRLPEDEHQLLAAYAERAGVSMNTVMAHAVHLFLAEPGRAAMLAHVRKARSEGGL